MRYKIFIVLIFIVSITNSFAGSLVSPFPAIMTSGIDTSIQYDLIKRSRFELFCSSGVSLNFSALPWFSVPALMLDLNINGSFFYNMSFTGLNLGLSTGVDYCINPFFYKNKFYDMDYLLSSTTDLTLNYRVVLRNGYYLEPYIGGRLLFFGSFINFYGIKPFASVIGGLEFILPLN